MNSLGLFDFQILSVQVGFTLFNKKKRISSACLLALESTREH